MDKLKYELNGKPAPKNNRSNVENNLEISNEDQIKQLQALKNEKNRHYRPEQELTLEQELDDAFNFDHNPSPKKENDFKYRPEQELKLEPEQKAGIVNENKPEMTEEECLSELESYLTPDLMAKFVMAHYADDDGNESPPTTAELEESFRSFIYQLGFRGPKIEGFIKRAVTVLDDYDITDKYDNIDQTAGIKMYQRDADIDYTSSLAGLEVDVNIQEQQSEEPDLGTRNTINPHLNNPYYINPNKKPTPFD